MPQPIPLPRLASVPPAEPPYDDERGPESGAPATYGSLALAPEPLGPLAPPPERPAELPGLPGPLSPRRPPGLPDERRLRGLGQALAEILAGRRPPQTVQDRLSPRAYRELVRAGKMIHAARPPLVGLPHVQRPGDGVVEMCMLVHCGERSRVLAVRLERQGVQWLVTEFETA
ncbi:Rv3235 family protein [Microbispora sp. NPDC049125]|uniref:Rv3235 family protein n=1 Tax=Microbispora sp. NPDC049125 TaxID=3154929 RepID=UPI00346603FC